MQEQEDNLWMQRASLIVKILDQTKQNTFYDYNMFDIICYRVTCSWSRKGQREREKKD